MNGRQASQRFRRALTSSWVFLATAGAGLAVMLVAPGQFAAGLKAAGQEIRPPLPGYKLSFDEEFDRLDLSADGSGYHTWYEGVWFNPHHAPLSNILNASSELSLVWTRNQISPDTSITTLSRDKQHHLTWRYGYFEARMKWDVVPGAWPALWLLPIQDATGEAINGNGVKESGEADIFEGQGDQPHSFYGTVHDWVNLHDSASKNNHFSLASTVDLSSYHTYGLLWSPGQMTWYLDGEPLHSELTPAIFDHQDFFIVISMQAGADWKANNLAGVSASTMSLTMDWLRVWKRQI